jgi:UDP-glucose:glycoprotein glucosyltransferase
VAHILRELTNPTSSISAFTVGDNSTALHYFAVILDPLSEQAQKYTSLFEVFTDLTIP